MLCSNCSTILNQQNKFCPKCGRKVIYERQSVNNILLNSCKLVRRPRVASIAALIIAPGSLISLIEYPGYRITDWDYLSFYIEIAVLSIIILIALVTIVKSVRAIPCPHCNSTLEVPNHPDQGVDCPICQKRVIIRNGAIGKMPNS